MPDASPIILRFFRPFSFSVRSSVQPEHIDLIVDAGGNACQGTFDWITIKPTRGTWILSAGIPGSPIELDMLGEGVDDWTMEEVNEVDSWMLY